MTYVAPLPQLPTSSLWQIILINLLLFFDLKSSLEIFPHSNWEELESKMKHIFHSCSRDQSALLRMYRKRDTGYGSFDEGEVVLFIYLIHQIFTLPDTVLLCSAEEGRNAVRV